ncbi:MAG: hypothetical protein QM784_01850 [Polyangiaceae bacterium]
MTQILEKRGIASTIIPLAQGSARLAIDLANSERLESRDQFVDAIRRAIGEKNLGSALDALGKKQEDREELKLQLAWVLARFSADAKVTAETDPVSAERLAQWHQIVLDTIRDLDRNGQPALMLEAMVTRLRRL